MLPCSSSTGRLTCRAVNILYREEVLPSDLRFLDVLRAQLKDPISIKVTYYFLRRGPIHSLSKIFLPVSFENVLIVVTFHSGQLPRTFYNI